MKLSFNSIKIRSFTYFFLFITILVLTVSYLSLEKIKISVFNSVDKILESKINLITNFMSIKNGLIDLEISEIVTGEYTIPKSGHYYKLIINDSNSGFENDNNHIPLKIAISPSLINPNFDFKIKEINYESIEKNQIVFTSIGPKLEPLRVIKREINFKGINITVYTAETIKSSLDIIKDFQYFVLIIFPLSLLFSALIILVIINNLLKPIKDFSQEVNSINHKNLEKRIDFNKYPTELKDMVLSFNSMLDRVHKAFETEKLILSEASHKLKTPIAVIKSHCDIILKKERPKEEYIDTIIAIKDSTKKVISLISGILSLANLESGNITFNKFDKISISECLKNAISLSEYLAYQKNIGIELLSNKDLFIRGDKDKITEAFLNIIENAIKYNQINGLIKIEVLEVDNKVNVSIQDNGIGIKKEDLSKIFDRFYRSENNKGIEGSGLGLNIAKTITESHNGKILVNSYLENSLQKTEFILSFPLANTLS